MRTVFRDYVPDVFLWASQQFKDLRSMHAWYQFVNAFPPPIRSLSGFAKPRTSKPQPRKPNTPYEAAASQLVISFITRLGRTGLLVLLFYGKCSGSGCMHQRRTSPPVHSAE